MLYLRKIKELKTAKKALPTAEYQKAMDAIRSRPLSALQFTLPVFIQPTVKEYICNILNQTSINNTNSLQDMNINAANTIVVLDDPISSFDSNFYYNAISVIGKTVTPDRSNSTRKHL